MTPSLLLLLVAVAAPPCNVAIAPGVGIGEVRLGMTRAALTGLGLRADPKAPEWFVRDGLRARLDRKGTVVVLRLDAGPEARPCPPVLPAGACRTDEAMGRGRQSCPTLGVNLAYAAPSNTITKVEVLRPQPKPAPRAACEIVVVPGKGAGPFRLGMSRAEAAAVGLGLEAYANRGEAMTAGSYYLELGTKERVERLRVRLAEDATVCFGTLPVDGGWRPEQLCERGFCGCVLEEDPVATGITHATCADRGIVFDFGREQLIGLVLQAPAAR